jgi:hypothetical protein
MTVIRYSIYQSDLFHRKNYYKLTSMFSNPFIRKENVANVEKRSHNM